VARHLRLSLQPSQRTVERVLDAGLRPGSSTVVRLDDGSDVEERRFSAASARYQNSRALAPAASNTSCIRADGWLSHPTGEQASEPVGCPSLTFFVKGGTGTLASTWLVRATCHRVVKAKIAGRWSVGECHAPTAASRTLLWRLSRWGSRDRRFSRERGNPGRQFLLWRCRLRECKRERGRDGPAHRRES